MRRSQDTSLRYFYASIHVSGQLFERKKNTKNHLRTLSEAPKSDRCFMENSRHDVNSGSVFYLCNDKTSLFLKMFT